MCASISARRSRGQRAVGVRRELGQAARAARLDGPGSRQLGPQAQAGRADEAGDRGVVGAERGAISSSGRALEIAQRERHALARREPLIGGADLAGVLAAGSGRARALPPFVCRS